MSAREEIWSIEGDFSSEELDDLAGYIEEQSGYRIEQYESASGKHYVVRREADISKEPVASVPGFGDIKVPDNWKDGLGRVAAVMPDTVENALGNGSFSSEPVVMNLREYELRANTGKDYERLEEAYGEVLEE